MATIRTLLFRVRKKGHIMRNVGLKKLTVTGHIESKRVFGGGGSSFASPTKDDN